MRYIPKLSAQEIEENHKHFSERVSLYKKKGLDSAESRKFILEKVRPLEGSILEIGTGTGYTTLVLAKAGYTFVSIDKDRETLKTAALNLAYEKLLSHVKFYVMNGKSLAFENGSFKNIVVVDLFHHIDEIDKVLSEIDRVLCADGKVVIADFNRKGMDIVGTVHKEEGRIHEDCSTEMDYIRSYFRGLGYDIKNFDDRCHWILIGRKSIQK